MSKISIPEDLADSDLKISDITKIIEIRAVKTKANAVLNPSDVRLRMARARVEWAQQAEEAIKDGKPVPPKPGRGEDDADPEDYGE